MRYSAACLAVGRAAGIILFPKNKDMIIKENTPVAICCDHSGYETKLAVIEYLKSQGIAVRDFGTHSTDSCDYPDFAHPCALAVESGECYPGIGICGSGEGINMTLNKHQGIRSALCWIPEIARLARLHNDANILAMGARVTGTGLARKIVDTFLDTEFSGAERHARRIRMIDED